MFDSPTHFWAHWCAHDGDLELIRESAESTQRAIDALRHGEAEIARASWEQVNGEALFEMWNRWTESSWLVRQHLLDVDVKAIGPRTKTPSQSLARRVFARDGYRCRYCQIRVFTRWKGSPIVDLIASFPDLTPSLQASNGSLRGSGRGGAIRNYDYSKFLWSMAAPEHVFPSSLGGATDEANVVTACWGCNSCKGEWTLEQMGVVNPLGG